MLSQIEILTLGGFATCFCGYQAWKADDFDDRRILWILGAAGSLTATAIVMVVAEFYRKVPLDVGGGKTLEFYQHDKTMHLKDLTALTDSHLQGLSAYPGLKQLRLEGCPLITREGLAALGETCPRLHTLSIKDCANIGVWGDEAILPSLVEDLIVRYQAQFSPTEIRHWYNPFTRTYVPYVHYNTACVTQHTCADVEHLGSVFTWTRKVTEWR